MRRLIVVVLALSLLPAIAATCVTPATQKSPSGPWVGEVTNDTGAAVSDSVVRGEITDATGRTLSVFAPTCPTRLTPGESATWEIAADGYGLVAPLTGVFRHETTAVDGAVAGAGLTATVVDRDDGLRAAAVSLKNQSHDTFGGLTICGSLRSSTGNLLDVSSVSVMPSQISPGKSLTAVIRFDSMPAGASIDVEPQGTRLCCAVPTVIGGDAFRVVTTQLTNAGFSDFPGVTRGLIVVGEMKAPYVVDALNVGMGAHIKGDPLYRDDRIAVGCAGAVKAGDAAPVMFMLPIPPGADERSLEFEVAGIEAYPSAGTPFVELPVRDVTVDEFVASGEIVNNTATWMRVVGTCTNARDGSRLAGSSSLSTQYIMAPGSREPVSIGVRFIGTPTAYEIVTYAEPLPNGPPTPVMSP